MDPAPTLPVAPTFEATKLESLLAATLWPSPLTRNLPSQDVDLDYRSFGFLIYRTSYEPTETSDMQWKTLLAKISEQALAEIGLYQKSGEEQVAARLVKLFSIDPVSDPALLEGKSRAEIRHIHLRRARAAEEPGASEDQPVPVWPGENLFLLADAEVLEGVTKDPFFLG